MKLLFAVLMLLISSYAGAQQGGFIGGISASTNNNFTVNQTIPYVITSLDVTNAAFSGGAKCDGVTDDHAALQAAISAGVSASAAVIVPKGKTCRTTAAISISGTTKIQGQGSAFYFDPSTALASAINISSSTGIDISGVSLSANIAGPGVQRAFNISGGSSVTEHDNIHIHDLTISGFQGCSAGNGGSILLSGVSDVEIDHITSMNNGCPSTGSSPGGFEITNYTAPSFRLNIHENKLLGGNTNFGIGLFDTNDSQITNNYVNEGNFPNSGTVPTSGGYGIMLYGIGVCANDLGTIAASPNGLVRTSNVVTVTTVGTCPALPVGLWVMVTGSTSVGGTSFNGDYVVTASSTNSITATLVNPVSLANDTGGGGAVGYSNRGNKVQQNQVYNASGMGIYLEASSDVVATGNIVNGTCLYFSDTSLPCGGIAVNSNERPVVNNNNVNHSLLDGIVLATSWGANISNNQVTNTVNSGIRFRTQEANPIVTGNTINNTAIGIKGDGIATNALIQNNTVTNFTAEGMDSTSSSSGNWLVQGNHFIGTGVSGVSAILFTGGSENRFDGNYVNGLLSASGFDVRTSANTLTNNYCYNWSGGTCFSLSSASTDNHVNGGMIFGVTGNGINDAGTRNTFSNIEMQTVGTPVTESGTGSIFQNNHYKGGASGGPVQTSCTLVAGTCTMTTAEVLATDAAKIQCGASAGTTNVGSLSIGSITAGTSYVVNSSNTSDTRAVSCIINH